MINFDMFFNKIEKLKLDGFKEDMCQELKEGIDELQAEILTKYRKKLRAVKAIAKEEIIPFNKLYSDYPIERLPSWIQNDIENTMVTGKSKKVLKSKDGRKYHMDNRLNHLSGAEWTYFTCSVLNTRYSTRGIEGCAHNIRKIHPSPKPPILMKNIIEFFTKEGELVFDYFAGVGGTLLGASMCNRTAVGVEINSEYIDAYKRASLDMAYKPQYMVHGDSVKILKQEEYLNNIFEGRKASLILIDPPYGNMMARLKTGESKRKQASEDSTPFTNYEEDLGNMDLIKFHEVFFELVKNSMQYLKDNGHLIIFIKDLQPEKKNLNLLHSDIIYNLNHIDNLYYQGLKIWADQSVNLFPYGYPYSFVSNQIHQYILVFKKKESS